MVDQPSILLIEDEARLRTNLQILLQSKGYPVTTAEHGAEGIQKVQEEPFDVVITDVVMPEMDGFQVMEYLKEHFPDTVVVAITAYVSTESAIEALRKGAYDYIAKPFDIDLLQITIKRALEKARMQKALRYYIREVEAKADAIRESEGRYRSLAEHAPDIVFSLDPQARFVFLNERVRELLGYQPEALLGRHFSELVAPEAQAWAREICHEVDEATPLPAVLPLIGQDRTRQVWVETSMVPLIDAHGQVVGVQGIARDVTRRKEMEEQLRRSEKLAAVGQLAAGVAHEVGNALAIIGGSIQYLLKNCADGHPYHEFLEVIQRNVTQADRTIRSLLSFARPRAPALAPVDIAQLLEGTCRLLTGELANQPISVVQRFSLDVPWVIADPEQLQQVFLNLLLNAIQAMPEGGVLTLTTAFDPEGNHVQIEVADTGWGIAQENLGRIFDPFFTTKEAGTGLGLCVSDRLIRAHGGRISVSSREGQGSVFTLTLPAIVSRG